MSPVRDTDGDTTSSNMSLVPTLEELIEILQYIDTIIPETK